MRELAAEAVPLPAGGNTAARHARLMAVAREDVSLAKLVEAHWDAVAILAEAGRAAAPGAVYGVWAAEIPGCSLVLAEGVLSGRKGFASGAGVIDRALVTVGEMLVDVDLRRAPETVVADGSAWAVDAFRATRTGMVTFLKTPLDADAILGRDGWYTGRAGFWHGACGPAACWAGAAAGLVDAARLSRREDAHTLAHLGAMDAGGWALEAYLERAGCEMDQTPDDVGAAMVRALRVRHLVEQTAADVLTRFARAYGPGPLTMDAAVGRRFRELEIYMRQSHAERDLEALGRRRARSA